MIEETPLKGEEENQKKKGELRRTRQWTPTCEALNYVIYFPVNVCDPPSFALGQGRARDAALSTQCEALDRMDGRCYTQLV